MSTYAAAEEAACCVASKSILEKIKEKRNVNVDVIYIMYFYFRQWQWLIATEIQLCVHHVTWPNAMILRFVQVVLLLCLPLPFVRPIRLQLLSQLVVHAPRLYVHCLVRRSAPVRDSLIVGQLAGPLLRIALPVAIAEFHRRGLDAHRYSAVPDPVVGPVYQLKRPTRDEKILY